MATLTLTKTWINLLTSGVAVSGQTARDRPENYTVPGAVRPYAGGRQRAVTSAGVLGTYKFQLLLVSRATVDTLYSWQGLTVQVRDHKGRRFFGVFYGLSIAEIVSRATWNVTIDLTVVTATEGV
jgi:hypothetical protein